jgi:hypothetical protein
MIRLYERPLPRVVKDKEGTTMKRKAIRIALATVALALVAAAAHAWGFSHENKLKFSRPVALPGIVLPAGTYVFDVASPTALDVVVVRNASRDKVYYMGFTRTVSRPTHMSGQTSVAFGEATATEPPPIAAWYEIGDTIGHEFLYR